MAQWYQVQEGDEIVLVRATNTRTALDKGFRQTCGAGYLMEPDTTMTFRIRRLSGRSKQFRLLESTYQENRRQVLERRRETLDKNKLIRSIPDGIDNAVREGWRSTE